MLSLQAQTRKELRKKIEPLRKQGVLPAVLYGSTIETASLSVDRKSFEGVYRQAGESSLISLDLEGKQSPVLIREVQRHSVSGEMLHVDFYQPALDHKIDIAVPLVIQGEAPAVKDLAGTLIQDMHEVEISALPQDLPHEVFVDVSGLKTFEDRVEVKDLQVAQGVEIKNDAEEVVARVVAPQNIEEELEKPIEENVEAVEQVKVEKKEKEEEIQAP
jgi:large subunit ribosomal protein L25